MTQVGSGPVRTDNSNFGLGYADGQFVYTQSAANGAVVTVDWTYNANAGGAACLLSGSIVSHPAGATTTRRAVAKSSGRSSQR